MPIKPPRFIWRRAIFHRDAAMADREREREVGLYSSRPFENWIYIAVRGGEICASKDIFIEVER